MRRVPRIMRLRVASIVTFAAFAPMACGGAERAPTEPIGTRAPPEPEPESAEWLYAIDRFRGDRPGECGHVYQWVVGEEKCRSRACRHGAKLGFDWIKTCSKLIPAKEKEVRRLTGEYERRASSGSTACEDQAETLIRDGCKNEESCAEDTQAWATRCAETAGTPLVVRMIELSVARTGARGFEVDPRSCSDLLGELKDAARCEPGFPCEDAMPKVRVYESRCSDPGMAPPADAALYALSVAHGAGAETPPTKIRLDRADVEASFGFPVLADGSGAIVSACGKRVSTLEGYFRARRACNGMNLAIARVVKPKGEPTLRLGFVPFATERSFARHYPSLVVDGEAEGLNVKSLAAFESALASAADAEPVRAVATLVQALIAHRGLVAESDSFRKALERRDAGLVAAFRRLGESKARAANPTLRAAELVPFVRRALVLPLADVTADGVVSVGNSTPAATVAIGDVLAKSAAAYREALMEAAKRAEKRRIRGEDVEAIAMTAGEQAAKCGDARKRVEESRGRLLDCAFGGSECDDEGVTAIAEKLDDALATADLAEREMLLALSSLEPAARSAARAVASEAGCVTGK